MYYDQRSISDKLRDSLEAQSAISIPVEKEWLELLKKDEEVYFKDTRGKKRRLLLIEKNKDGWIAQLSKTTFIEAGTKLKYKINQTEVRETTVADLRPLEAPLLLKTGDKLILHKEDRLGEAAQYDTEGNLLHPAHLSCTLPDIMNDIRQENQYYSMMER